jgi:hypothetical protein
MKRAIFLTALASVLSGLVPGAASSAPTLASLNAKLNCLVRYPATEYLEYAWYGLNPAPQPSSANVPPTFAGFDPANPATYPPADPPLRNWGPATALDFSYGFPTDAWLLGVKKSSKCLKKFRVAPNPHPARPASFRAHRLAAWR